MCRAVVKIWEMSKCKNMEVPSDENKYCAQTNSHNRINIRLPTHFADMTFVHNTSGSARFKMGMACECVCVGGGGGEGG